MKRVTNFEIDDKIFGKPIDPEIANLERKMRSRKFTEGCDLTKFKAYAQRYGCNDDEYFSVMSIFFIHDDQERKV